MNEEGERILQTVQRYRDGLLSYEEWAIFVRTVVCAAVQTMAEGDWQEGHTLISSLYDSDAVQPLLIFLGTAVALLSEGTGQSATEVILKIEKAASKKSATLIPDLIAQVEQISPDDAKRFQDMFDSATGS
jgi:hypothetical protein